ncbi:pyridoxamine 5'-phosphate oxidase family protein [Seohaeicola zhoushanensis]
MAPISPRQQPGQPRLADAGRSGSKIYATIDGAMALSDDKAKLDELWSPIAGAWFDEGKEDKDVRLVRMTPARAEVWATDGAAGFLYEIAKANLTGEQPDMGEHARITF